MTPNSTTGLVELAERFNARHEKRGPDECWPWTGCVMKKDQRGVLHWAAKNIVAPRVSWFVHHNEWPPTGIFVCHSCDNPNCVNPAHLWLGSPGDNTRDAAAKGRLHMQQDDKKLFGSAHGQSKLTEREIPLIREMHKNGLGSRAIAKAFSISRCSIRRILSGEGWTHV